MRGRYKQIVFVCTTWKPGLPSVWWGCYTMLDKRLKISEDVCVCFVRRDAAFYELFLKIYIYIKHLIWFSPQKKLSERVSAIKRSLLFYSRPKPPRISLSHTQTGTHILFNWDFHRQTFCLTFSSLGLYPPYTHTHYPLYIHTYTHILYIPVCTHTNTHFICISLLCPFQHPVFCSSLLKM